MSKNPWSPEEDEYLRTNWSSLSRKNLAKLLDRSVRDVMSRGLYVLGLPKTRRTRSRKFTEEEDQVIRDNVKKISYAEISTLLGKDWKRIADRARYLGLRKNNVHGIL